MAPFQYEQYRNPFVGSIGELMMRPAQAQAQAEVTKGNAWAGAAQNIGQTVAGAATALVDPRRQLEDAQLVEMQRNQQGRAVLAQAIKQFTNQKGQVDHQAIANAVAQAGFPEQGEAWLKMASSNAEALDKLRDSTLSHQKLQVETAGDLAFHAASLDDFTAAVGLAAAHGLVDERTAQGILQQADTAGPEGWKALQQKFLPFSPSYRKQKDELSKPMDVGPGHQVIVPGGASSGQPQTVASVPEEPGKGDYTGPDGLRYHANGQPVTGKVMTTPSKPGSPEDFVATYAKEKFGLTDPSQMNVAQKAEAMGAEKAANTDPQMRDAALAQKNIATALQKMREGQQPTAEDAQTVADDLVNHRQSPSQVKLLFGTRGVEGQAFMLKVQTAAKKIDPAFNYEEAESSFQLAKSTGFQNTVRLMDSVQESMPRLLANARTLGNGDWRSWNQLANAAKNQFNSTDLKRLKTDALLVGDEVAKILSGGGTGSATSDAKLKQGVDIFGSSDSVPAIAAALDEVQALIGNRRRSLTRGTYMEGSSAVKPQGDTSAMIEAFDDKGNIHHAPAGTALPAGWKLKQ